MNPNDRDIDNPAAWLIMNAISNLHNVGRFGFMIPTNTS